MAREPSRILFRRDVQRAVLLLYSDRKLDHRKQQFRQFVSFQSLEYQPGLQTQDDGEDLLRVKRLHAYQRSPARMGSDSHLACSGNTEHPQDPSPCVALYHSPLAFAGYPLHVAVSQNKPAIVKALLLLGARRNVKTRRGLTPEDLARRSGFQEVLNVLEQATLQKESTLESSQSQSRRTLQM